MKCMALVRIRDCQVLHSWSSGDCDSYKAKYDLDSKEQAEEFIKEIEEKYEKYNVNRSKSDMYKVTSCILSYDDSQNKDIESFFRYM